MFNTFDFIANDVEKAFYLSRFLKRKNLLLFFSGLGNSARKIEKYEPGSDRSRIIFKILATGIKRIIPEMPQKNPPRITKKKTENAFTASFDPISMGRKTLSCKKFRIKSAIEI